MLNRLYLKNHSNHLYLLISSIFKPHRSTTLFPLTRIHTTNRLTLQLNNSFRINISHSNKQVSPHFKLPYLMIVTLFQLQLHLFLTKVQNLFLNQYPLWIKMTKLHPRIKEIKSKPLIYWIMSINLRLIKNLTLNK